MPNYTNSAQNARKHGCCAIVCENGVTSLLPNESAADFRALEQTWLTAYTPTTDPERHLVAELINADWLLQRTTRTYLDIETRLYTESPNPLDWTDHQQRTLGRFLRYKTAHANSVARCRKAIQDYRKARLTETTTQQKLEIIQKKNGPIVDWQQHLLDMRAQAIALGFTPPES